jgi:16S rRNA (adenine1518-N6/adenine1519-N6)-dimethyltransferase
MVRPKKYLGQHFLTDPEIARRIAGSFSPYPSHLLEIGPGKGILTQAILEHSPENFSMVEIDQEAITHLKKTFPQLQEQIIEGDFLKLDLHNVFDHEFAVIGNFPYNISSQILFKVLDSRTFIPELIGMFQKEVADRIAASHGNKTYGILSVLIQAFYKVERLFTLNEGAFFPPPRVKSTVIKLTRKEVDPAGSLDTLLFRVVKTAFNQRRKTLRNALRIMQVEQKIPPHMLTKRAEELTIEDFIELTKEIEKTV